MKNFYYLLFYKIYKIVRFLDSQGNTKLRSLVVFSFLQILIYPAFTLLTSVLFKSLYLINLRVELSLLGLLLLFNYKLIMRCKEWTIYEKKFKRFSKRLHLVINLFFIMIFFCLIGLLIITSNKYDTLLNGVKNIN